MIQLHYKSLTAKELKMDIKYHADKCRLEREIKAEYGFNKIDYEVLDKMIEEVDSGTHLHIHSEEDYYDLIKDYYYETIIENCEHDDYDYEDDEYCTGPDIHGNPQYSETRYKVCNICGATCPVYGVERTGEDDYDEICGEWQR